MIACGALVWGAGCNAILGIDPPIPLKAASGDANDQPVDAPHDGDTTTLCAATPGRGDGASPATLLCNGTTTDVLGSPGACGACDHDCAGGSCTTGVCSSEELLRSDDELMGPALFGGSLWYTSVRHDDAGFPESVTINAAWADGGTQALATYPADPNVVGAFYDPPSVTFVGGGFFQFGRVDDPDAGLKMVGDMNSLGLAITPDHLYALRNDDAGSVVDIDRGSHEVRPFAEGQGARRFIVADSQEVYWIREPSAGETTGELRRRTRGSGGVEQLLPISSPAGLALDSAYVYFATMSAGFVEVKRVRRDVPKEPESLSTLDDPALTPTTWSALDVDGCEDNRRTWSRPFNNDDPKRPLYLILRLNPPSDDLTIVEVPRCGGTPRRTLLMKDVRTFSGAGAYYHFTEYNVLRRGAR